MWRLPYYLAVAVLVCTCTASADTVKTSNGERNMRQLLAIWIPKVPKPPTGKPLPAPLPGQPVKPMPDVPGPGGSTKTNDGILKVSSDPWSSARLKMLEVRTCANCQQACNQDAAASKRILKLATCLVPTPGSVGGVAKALFKCLCEYQPSNIIG